MRIGIGLKHKEYILENTPASLCKSLQESLLLFAKQHYYMEEESLFTEQAIAIEKGGILVVFYSKDGQILGFTRLVEQRLIIEQEEIHAFWGQSWHDPHLLLTPTIVRYGLVHALRQKLFRPQEKLLYITTANCPQRFSYLRQLQMNSEPNAQGNVSQSVQKIIEEMAKLHHWKRNAQHPMVIQQSFLPKEPLLPTEEESKEFSRFNPDYPQGNSLLLCFAVDMDSIGRCLKQTVSEPVYW